MYTEKVIPYKEQGPIRDTRLLYRLENILPKLMQEEAIDMWIVTSQENNEDPVMKTVLPSPMLNSSRRTILIFFQKEDGTVERLAIGRPGGPLSKAYNEVWTNPKDSDWAHYASLSGAKIEVQGQPETQMECLKRIITERNPKKIGLNYAETDSAGYGHGYGDGISHGSFNLISQSIGTENASKIVSASRLCVRWLESRSPEEMTTLKGVVSLTAEIVKRSLSSNIVHPGVSTASSVSSWIMQHCQDLGLKPWFPFYIVVRREGSPGLHGDTIIQEGDILHLDMGVEYLGLCSDIQCNAYVLKRGESEPPSGIKALFQQGKRLQDIVADEFTRSRTGNEILANSLKKAQSEGINGMIYTHPIGYFGHAPGAGIGYVDNQKGVKGWGEHPVYDNTAYALELNVSGPIPEWGGSKLMLGIETDVIFTGGKIHYYFRQQELFTI